MMDLSDFKADARIAITANPDYFVWWYSAKSILLVLAIAALAYQIGRAKG